MTQCCTLDPSGARCKGEARGLLRVFIDSEMYHTGRGLNDDFPASWVLVPVCENHKRGNEIFLTTYQVMESNGE